MAKVSPRRKNDNLNEFKAIIAEVEALQRENTELRAQLEEFTRQAKKVIEGKENGAELDGTSPVILADEGTKVTDGDTKVTDGDTKVTDGDTKVTNGETKVTDEDEKVIDAEDEEKLQEKVDKMTEENKLLKILLHEGSNLVTDFRKLLEENKQLKGSMKY
ncbi:uncharacterized protein LOC118422584 [Branchiostoma floridae]|uniref:Uncharacterized protein LOC118422584 n=1 Tax=Branchiostoma floridae TaxID=7739 RepID=C3XVX5_BRAFL|nr:uncharacterized protein LOC118422584 [Branchiostoma floridae]|eukprot:XP_002611750.1 hypothetical protein BRAFLDRAFT_99097 [Branchiostoma floridae]